MPRTRLGRCSSTLLALLCLLSLSGLATAESQFFRRGDSNGDGVRDVADAIFTLNYLFVGGVTPQCDDATDTNDDGVVDMADGVWLLGFLFSGAAAPPSPDGECGVDPTDDGLGCDFYGACPGATVDFNAFVVSLFAATADDSDPESVNDLVFVFDDDPMAFDDLLSMP